VSLERTAGYVRIARIFNSDEVISGRQRCVTELIALFHFTTYEFHLRGAADADRQCTTTGIGRVHNELAYLTWDKKNNNQPFIKWYKNNSNDNVDYAK